jgi:hypothetical protein
MIPANTRIRIMAGMTDMRRGLAVLIDTVQSAPQAGSLSWILQLQLFLCQNQRFPFRRLLQRPYPGGHHRTNLAGLDPRPVKMVMPNSPTQSHIPSSPLAGC